MMQRRSFIKNIAALAIISQIGITAVFSVKDNNESDGMVLVSNGEGNRKWIKMPNSDIKLYLPVK